MIDKVWQVTEGGLSHELRIASGGLNLSRSGDIRQFIWSEVREIKFPASFSMSITTISEQLIVLGFASANEQRRFRTALENSSDAQSAPGEPTPLVEKRIIKPVTPSVLLLTVHDIPGRTVSAHHGLITAHTVIGRNALSDFGSDLKNSLGGNLGALEKAIQRASTKVPSAFRRPRETEALTP